MGIWSDAARDAAAREFGRRHVNMFAFFAVARVVAPGVGIAIVLGLIVWGAWWLWGQVGPAVLAWGPAALITIGSVAAAAVLLLIGVRFGGRIAHWWDLSGWLWMQRLRYRRRL